MDKPKTSRDEAVSEVLAVAAAKSAAMFDLSRATWFKLMSMGAIPKPLRLPGLSRSPRWSVDELRAWRDANCPPCDRWEAMKGRT